MITYPYLALSREKVAATIETYLDVARLQDQLKSLRTSDAKQWKALLDALESDLSIEMVIADLASIWEDEGDRRAAVNNVLAVPAEAFVGQFSKHDLEAGLDRYGDSYGLEEKDIKEIKSLSDVQLTSLLLACGDFLINGYSETGEWFAEQVGNVFSKNGK